MAVAFGIDSKAVGLKMNIVSADKVIAGHITKR
jgi:heterodisulfide reductase subunit B